MMRAFRAFENAIRLLEDVFEDIEKEEFDFHDANDTSIFYILEDYASIHYALGHFNEAEKYFKLLHSIDTHNHMRADIALDFLSREISWNDYVDFLDQTADRYGTECGEVDGEPSKEH